MGKIQPRQVVEILRKNGTEVTIEQAEEILKFLRMLADMQVAQWLREKEELERAIEKS